MGSNCYKKFLYILASLNSSDVDIMLTHAHVSKYMDAGKYTTSHEF
uniref:Uncharacterized protein n=1 Tax=Rhizophora mucronata TaxID=61149 RepID=A0A2P2NY60_RHIMU